MSIALTCGQTPRYDRLERVSTCSLGPSCTHAMFRLWMIDEPDTTTSPPVGTSCEHIQPMFLALIRGLHSPHHECKLEWWSSQHHWAQLKRKPLLQLLRTRHHPLRTPSRQNISSLNRVRPSHPPNQLRSSFSPLSHPPTLRHLTPVQHVYSLSAAEIRVSVILSQRRLVQKMRRELVLRDTRSDPRTGGCWSMVRICDYRDHHIASRRG